MKIKICGLTKACDARLCAVLGADMLGFVFYKDSPRYIDIHTVKNIVKQISGFVWKVGVFVDEDVNEIARIAQYCDLDTIQLHGKETPEECGILKRADFNVIKALPVWIDTLAEVAREYVPYVDSVLLDLKVHGWGVPKSDNMFTYKDNLIFMRNRFARVMFAGHITIDNVDKLIDEIEPWGIDVSSGVEDAPGEKSQELLKKFFKKIQTKFEV